MTSLAAQLAQNASLNASILVDRSRRKPGESYLFSRGDADRHDLDSLRALGINGLIQLSALNPAFRQFEDDIFSEGARSTDRTLLSSEANAQLDKVIAALLSLMGPYLLEVPTNKVLEWLVRRFRINEFNVEAILALFLPYHESSHFAKMLSILHIKQNSTWSFLLPFKSAAQSVPRLPLVTEMVKNTDVARFVTSLLPLALKQNHVHRTLVAFNTVCLDDFISRSKALDEGTVAFLLPALIQPLQLVEDELEDECTLASYILLARFSQKIRMSASAIKAIVGAMTGSASRVPIRQFLTGLIAVLSAQEEQEQFSGKTSKQILRLPAVNTEICNLSKLVGFEKVVIPLLNGLAKKLEDDAVQSLMTSLVTCTDTPKIIVAHISKLLLQHVVSSDTSHSTLRSLLYSIHQRYPAVLHSVSQEIVQGSESDAFAVQQLLISLSLEVPVSCSEESHSQKHDMVVASADAESNVRVFAVKELIESLSHAENLSLADLSSIRSALVARVQDTDTQVLETLYEKMDIVATVLLEDAKTYLDTLVSSLCSSTSKPKRSLLKAHLAFLTKHFIPKANQEVVADAFHRIIFPFLLFSRPRQHTAELVWDSIKESMSDAQPNAFELLHGCVAIVDEEKSKNEEGIQMMSRINHAVASRIARNMLSSNEYNIHFESFITKLQADNPHVQIFAYLIMRALIEQLSGEHQIDAAYKTMKAMGLNGFADFGSLSLDSSNALGSLDGMELAKHTVVKPSSKSTLHWLQLAIISIVPSVSAPGILLDWTADLDITSMDIRGRRYIELMRIFYRVANMSSSSPHLIASLLSVLFTNLKDDSLVFLAGVWSGADKDAKGNDPLLVAALMHSSAFLQAHIDENDGVDYQTIIPLLLVPLSNPSALVRQAALTCLSQLQTLAQRPFSIVYKFDAIYGANSGKLQYLDQGDIQKYLTSLSEESDHLIHDNAFVRLCHERHLKRAKSDRRKEYEYKHRILCYLFSHIQALSLLAAQVTLLKILEHIPDKDKARILSPLIGALTSTDKPLPGGAQEELATLCIAAFDSLATSELNEDKSTLWNLYVAVVRRFFSSGESSRLRATISSCLEKGFFNKLSQERKVSISELVMEIGASDSEMYGPSKKLLGSVLTDVPLIIHLLSILQPPVGRSPRASKRPKTADDVVGPMRHLALLIEVLGTKSLPGSLDLISELLGMINRVAQTSSPAQVDISYIEQLLMSAIDSSTDRITETLNIAPSTIRLDILVELVRVSDNPQTFHQALLLISKLSRLAPESVLHNVMPVFTFMGSNVFHRDDTYSFKVVQQTIESIVPFMVSSLKRSHTEKLDLYIASRDFLRVFTDASNHIPRHRRNHFFFHLVDVLGPNDFLAPVVMLLVAKFANRVVRQSHEEAQTTVALPMAILQRSPPTLQIAALTEILCESQRLVALVIDPDTIQSTLLGDPAEDLKRCAKALITFIGIVAKSSSAMSGSLVHVSSSELSPLISILISLASLKLHSNPDVDAEDIQQIAYTSLASVLSAMPAASFVASVLTVLESHDSEVQAGALDLLTERLPMIADDVRQAATDSVKKIIEWIRIFITSHYDSPVSQSAFRALRSIGFSLQTGEEATINEAIPSMLSIIKQETATAKVALASLVPLSTRLGPRFIPRLRETVMLCIAKVPSESTANDAYAVLHGLLVAVPTFWGTKELVKVISMFTEHWATSAQRPPTAMKGLIKAVSKRIPSKALLSSLLEMWPTYAAALDKTETGAFFDILTRAMRNADRVVVLELLHQLVKVFLEALEVVAAASNPVVENNLISAFKQFVIKLNESAFKPFYRRIYDWAYAGDAAETTKRILFCRIYASLLDFFKALMTPYMSLLLQPLVQDLQAFSKATTQDEQYWVAMLDMVTKSFKLDDGGYWRDDKLREISTPLIAQVEVCIQLNLTEQRQSLQDCLEALLDNATDDSLLKAINLELLMNTRSEDVRIRIYALSCAEVLWRNHGGKLRGFVAETATFIAECNEDDNDLVVKESLKLKSAVENVAGSIAEL